MVREPAHFTGDDVERDDLLTIGVPGCDAPIEYIGAIFRGDEGPVLENSLGRRCHMDAVFPRRPCQQALIVRKRPLLGVTQPSGVIRNVYSPQFGHSGTVCYHHIVPAVRWRDERAVVSTERPELIGPGGNGP